MEFKKITLSVPTAAEKDLATIVEYWEKDRLRCSQETVNETEPWTIEAAIPVLLSMGIKEELKAIDVAKGFE